MRVLTNLSNPIIEAVGLEATRLIFKNIGTAFERGEDLEARVNLTYAATLAGLALNAGASWSHSFSYTIGPRYKIPHGLGCCMGLPYVMELNIPFKAEILARVAEAAGEDVRGLTCIEAAYRAVAIVKKLIEDMEMPLALKDLQIPKEVLPQLAKELVTKYPRPTSHIQLTEADAIQFYKRLWAGEMMLLR